jgi:hypothetical protein
MKRLFVFLLSIIVVLQILFDDSIDYTLALSGNIGISNTNLLHRALALLIVRDSLLGGTCDINRKTINADIIQYSMMQESSILRRIADSDLIVVGKVIDIRSSSENRTGPLSEHNPQWSEALIHIKAVKKGGLPDHNFTVFFPASFDVRWYKSPKLRLHQEGIFILHRQTIEDLGINGYTALDPLDVQPTDQLERISMLLSQNQSR